MDKKETLKALNSSNAEKMLAIERLQKEANVPSLESIEKILSYIKDNVPKELYGVSLIKELIKKTHEMAGVLDVDSKAIDELFDKYGITAPKFE